MPRGRVPIRLQVGHKYRTDSDVLMHVIKHFPANEERPFLCLGEDGELYQYTEKGRYDKKFGNHPLHINHEVIIRNGREGKLDPRRRGRVDWK